MGDSFFCESPPAAATWTECLRETRRIGKTESGSSCSVPLKFPLGAVTHVEIGQTGRAIIGKLQPPRGCQQPLWQFGFVCLLPYPESHAPADRRFDASIGPDGRFRFDDVPPGRYRFDFEGTDASGELAEIPIFVPYTDRPLNQPLDLGVLQLRKHERYFGAHD